MNAKLFILHGWTYYANETWKPMLAELRTRGIDFEFLLIPGLTDGTNPVWTLDDYVRWLEQKTSICEKIVLWGHSNGGRISLAYAAKHPEKVERLILEDSAGIPPRGLRRTKRDILRSLSQKFHYLASSEYLRKLVYKVIRESDYRQATPEMRKTMANLVYADLTPLLARISCPTLIIWGARDATTPLIDGKLMHERIHGSRMHVFPDAAHSPHMTHPRELADLVAQELDS